MPETMKYHSQNDLSQDPRPRLQSLASRLLRNRVVMVGIVPCQTEQPS